MMNGGTTPALVQVAGTAADDTGGATAEPSVATPTKEGLPRGVDAYASAYDVPPLPPVMGALRDSDTVRLDEISRLQERLSAAEHANSGRTTRRSALQSISLGATSEAVGLLLHSASGGGGESGGETPLEAVVAERDQLMACVVASFVGPRRQTETIAAVAKRFAAGGKLTLAVPLLFLIGRGVSACELLQRSGWWEHAANLAKASLPPSDRAVILGRWADALLARGDVHRAIEILLSLGRVQEVAERLLEIGAFDKAALLLCSLREAHEARRGELASFAFRGAARVLLEYAAFLTRLSLHSLAVRYTSLARATADTVQGGDEALTEIEAAQLVVQLARLQERREQHQ